MFHKFNPPGLYFRAWWAPRLIKSKKYGGPKIVVLKYGFRTNFLTFGGFQLQPGGDALEDGTRSRKGLANFRKVSVISEPQGRRAQNIVNLRVSVDFTTINWFSGASHA